MEQLPRLTRGDGIKKKMLKIITTLFMAIE